MYRKARPFFLHCHTPLHAGMGSDVGLVDLPIQREKHTGYPKIESSSLKGCVREHFERIQVEQIKWPPELKTKENLKAAIDLAFGPENAEHAGALGFTDARILLFPVKSLRGVFAWITCPTVLDRWKEDFALAQCPISIDIPKDKNKAFIPSNQSPLLITESAASQQVVLEEFAFKAEPNDACKKLAKCLADWLFPEASQAYFHRKLRESLVILPDDDFRDFVTLSTEVVTRTKINHETGTVEGKALFTEEYLPTDSILYSLALAASLFYVQSTSNPKGVFAKLTAKKEEEPELLLRFFAENVPKIVQLGGNASLGKGLLHVKACLKNESEQQKESASHDAT